MSRAIATRFMILALVFAVPQHEEGTVDERGAGDNGAADMNGPHLYEPIPWSLMPDSDPNLPAPEEPQQDEKPDQDGTVQSP
jgi:hypothetical protein